MKLINLKFLVGVGVLELLVIIAFAIIVHGILKLKCESVESKDEEDSNLIKLRKLLIGAEHAVLWIVTGALVLWIAIQFFMKNAVVEISLKTGGILFFVVITLIYLIYFIINTKYAGAFILIQILIAFFACNLGNMDYSVEKELIDNQKNVQYIGKETKMKINKGNNKGSTFVDFHYLVENDIETTYTTEDYEITIVRDLAREEEEYYNIYTQIKHNQYKGLGCEYVEKIKPLIEIHTYRIN